MLCLDVTKVTIYGKLRESWEVQQEQAYLRDQGLLDDMYDDDAMTSYGKLEQITSVSKLNVIPNAGMKRLWVEGNRIKVRIVLRRRCCSGMRCRYA